MLIIVDYGVGNLASIRNMFNKIGVESVISTDQNIIDKADKLVLPGVGAFDSCIEKFTNSGLHDLLSRKVLEERTPVLGICVGMQMLTEGSEEGKLPGLGWIGGKIVRFEPKKMPPQIKIPHMGWANVHLTKRSSLFEGLDDESRFYFVHSYHAKLANVQDELLNAFYGYKFTAALERDNILGVQFHPEKSHKFGMKLLANFVKNY